MFVWYIKIVFSVFSVSENIYWFYKPLSSSTGKQNTSGGEKTQQIWKFS